MTNSERFVFWLAERLGVYIVPKSVHTALIQQIEADKEEWASESTKWIADYDALQQGHLAKQLEKASGDLEVAKTVMKWNDAVQAELITIIETQFDNARMTTHSGMHNRETEAFWGGITYVCAKFYEKLNKEVPQDITTLLGNFVRLVGG